MGKVYTQIRLTSVRCRWSRLCNWAEVQNLTHTMTISNRLLGFLHKLAELSLQSALSWKDRVRNQVLNGGCSWKKIGQHPPLGGNFQHKKASFHTVDMIYYDMKVYLGIYREKLTKYS